MKTRNASIPASYLILEKDGKILLGRRCNTGYRDGDYQVPAGHVEEGELPTEALIREAKEEVGIDIDSANVHAAHVMYRPKHDPTGDRVDFFFRVTEWSGEPSIMEPNKCDDLGWFSFDELPDSTTYHVRKALELSRQGIMFSEMTIDEIKENNLYLL